MWSRALDTWWYRHVEVPTAEVVAWADLPMHHDQATGTLWWVDSEIGEFLAMIRGSDFVDLDGHRVDVLPSGSARLYHPAEAAGLVAADLWQDRILELGFDPAPQVLRPVMPECWSRPRFTLPYGPGSLRPLQARGWTLHKHRASRQVLETTVRLDVFPPETGTGEIVVTCVGLGNIPVEPALLPAAVRSEVLQDATRGGAVVD